MVRHEDEFCGQFYIYLFLACTIIITNNSLANFITIIQYILGVELGFVIYLLLYIKFKPKISLKYSLKNIMKFEVGTLVTVKKLDLKKV